jgi:sortase B
MSVVVSSIVMVYSAYSIFSQWNTYRTSAEKYEELEVLYQESEKLKQGQQDENQRQDDFLVLNEDYVGWIVINNTKVNYPVVKGKDNEFYLTHNFYKESDFAGAIFMDFRNSRDRLDKHTILYGHHMKDKSMFGDLENYLNQEFYQNHRVITFDFHGHTYEWEVFSVYINENQELLKTEFLNDQDFSDYSAEMKNRSIYSTEIEAGQDDTILTLSTCTNELDNERIIVHAKLTHGRENIEP